MNYLIIHRPSNSIINVVAFSTPIGSDGIYKAIRVSDKVLEKYYKLKIKKGHNGPLVDVGEMASISPAFREMLV